MANKLRAVIFNLDGVMISSELYRKIVIPLEEHPYPLIPYVKDLIIKLSETSLSLAVTSSSSKESMIKVLKDHKLEEYFDCLISGNEVIHSKPAPDIYLYAAKLLHINPAECLVIEDSNLGVQAAKLADVCCIQYANPNSKNQELHKADYIIEGFEEVDPIFLSMVYCHLKGLPLQIGETDRLAIRELSNNDIQNLYVLCKKSGDNFMSLSLDDELKKFEAYIKNQYTFYGYGLWGLFLKKGNLLIGLCGFEAKESAGAMRPELGYFIEKDVRKMGYAKEAASYLIDYGFQTLKFQEIALVTEERNLASKNLANKLGMRESTKISRNGQDLILFLRSGR